MASFIFKWIWQSLGIFITVFFIAMVLVFAKSYDLVDFETRSNQFTERILTYAQEDGVINSSDFTTERVAFVIDGDQTTSEIISLKLQLMRIDTSTEPEIEPVYYSEDTYKRQNPVVNLQDSYEKVTSKRYIYVEDSAENMLLEISYIYKK